jgi:hypothetical protein
MCFCPMGDMREWGTRETRPTPRLRTNFEVSIQLGTRSTRHLRPAKILQKFV